MSGIPLIITFVIAIALMIYAISKLKIHPFLSIMAVSLLFGLVAGIPLADLPNVIGTGFRVPSKVSVCNNFGALIGTLLEKTGSPENGRFCCSSGRKKNPNWLCCCGLDCIHPRILCSGLLFSTTRKAMVKRTMRSSVASTVALPWDYIFHCFIHQLRSHYTKYLYEGAGQGNLLGNNVCILASSCRSLPAISLQYQSARVKDREELGEDNDAEITQTYEELVASYGKLPNAWLSFAPIVVPILLMSLSSAFAMAKLSVPVITFFGTPIIAIAVGVLFALGVLVAQKRTGDFYELTNETLSRPYPLYHSSRRSSWQCNR